MRLITESRASVWSLPVNLSANGSVQKAVMQVTITQNGKSRAGARRNRDRPRSHGREPGRHRCAEGENPGAAERRFVGSRLRRNEPIEPTQQISMTASKVPQGRRTARSRRCHLRKIYPLTGKQRVTPSHFNRDKHIAHALRLAESISPIPRPDARSNGFVNHVTATVGLRITATRTDAGGTSHS